jgi:hypothetical protein
MMGVLIGWAISRSIGDIVKAAYMVRRLEKWYTGRWEMRK